MQVRAAAFAIAVFLAAPQSLPRTKNIVGAVTAYVGRYQREFVQLVADEQATQRVLTRGSVTATRESRGELFSTFLDDSGAWMSLHDVQSVDGEPVTGRLDVRDLLRSHSIRELGPQLAASNARFNLGHVSRNFNEPTLALLLFTPAHVRDLSIDRGPRNVAADASPLVALRVRLDSGAPLVRSLTRRVETRGTFLVEPDTGRVRRTTVMFDDGEVTAELETSYAADAHVNVWVPVTFTERYAARKTAELIEVSTALSNYRRFETTGRIVP